MYKYMESVCKWCGVYINLPSKKTKNCPLFMESVTARLLKHRNGKKRNFDTLPNLAAELKHYTCISTLYNI